MFGFEPHFSPFMVISGMSTLLTSSRDMSTLLMSSRDFLGSISLNLNLMLKMLFCYSKTKAHAEKLIGK